MKREMHEERPEVGRDFLLCLSAKSKVQDWLVLGGGAVGAAVRVEIMQKLLAKVKSLGFILPAVESSQKVLSRRVT